MLNNSEEQSATQLWRLSIRAESASAMQPAILDIYQAPCMGSNQSGVNQRRLDSPPEGHNEYRVSNLPPFLIAREQTHDLYIRPPDGYALYTMLRI